MREMIQSQNNSPQEAAQKAEKSAGLKSLLPKQAEARLEKNEENSEMPHGDDTCEKKVEVISDQGVVVAIKVYCSCGEVTEIDCHYDEL